MIWLPVARPVHTEQARTKSYARGNSMKRRPILSPFRKLLLLIVSTILLLPCTASADVVKVVVDSVIHPLSAEYIDRAVQDAERTHADALLIEIRTPGGLMTSMEDIVHRVLDSKVPVIIYVSPSGKG